MPNKDKQLFIKNSKWLKTLAALSLVVITSSVFASPSEPNETATDPHAHHRMMMQNKDNYSKSYDIYDLPANVLTDKHGKKVNIHDYLHAEKPMIMSFIFTTCTTICPVLTATLASAQNDLLSSPVKPVLISISIDPEVDTPDKLTAYAKKFKASDEWVFLTGTSADIIEIQRALKIYRGSKLNHEPVTILKAPGKKWLTLDGFTSASDLVKEYRSYSSNE